MFKRFVCFLLCLMLVLTCGGCGKQAALAPATVPTQPASETTAPPETAAPTTIPETELPTEAPTTAPTEPEVILHSGLWEDGTFDEHTLFVGDSLTFLMITDYLKKFDCIGDAKYAVKAGVQLEAFFNKRYPMTYDPELNCLYVPEFKGLTMAEAAASMGEDLHAVYIMLGTNYSPNATADSYIEICDFILENCPNATIHLQLIPYSPIVKYQTVNGRIQGAYEHYQQMGEQRVMLIDTNTAIGNHLIPDKVHLDDVGRENWYLALLAHARENDLER